MLIMRRRKAAEVSMYPELDQVPVLEEPSGPSAEELYASDAMPDDSLPPPEQAPPQMDSTAPPQLAPAPEDAEVPPGGEAEPHEAPVEDAPAEVGEESTEEAEEVEEPPEEGA